MRIGRPPKAPIYVLPYGIEVIGEYPPDRHNQYWRVRIRPHRFFPNVRERFGGIYVRRSRVVLASKLGRPLTPEEHAHHGDEDKQHDAPTNLGAVSPSEHNSHHKAGARHTPSAKNRITAGLKQAYIDGRRERPAITKRDSKGRIAA